MFLEKTYSISTIFVNYQIRHFNFDSSLHCNGLQRKTVLCVFLVWILYEYIIIMNNVIFSCIFFIYLHTFFSIIKRSFCHIICIHLSDHA